MRNFNEVYETLYKEKNAELEILRKKKLRTILVMIGISILIAIIVIKNSLSFMIPFIFLLCIIDALILWGIEKKYNYKNKFKREIVGTFIKECDSNLRFHPEKGIVPRVYLQGEFERFDKYSSEDLIEGMLEEKYRVIMAEVHTQEETRDSDGHTHTYTLFHGIFGQVECAKTIPGFIKIHSDKGFFGKLFGKRDKIEMDSTEFEKNFDVYGTDHIVTMQILTSDIMAMLVDFKEKHKFKYELTIKDNLIYIRFHTGEVFEPNTFKESLDYSTLKRYYDIIDFIFKVTREINKVIEETEI